MEPQKRSLSFNAEALASINAPLIEHEFDDFDNDVPDTPRSVVSMTASEIGNTWNFRNTLAYWSSILSIQAAFLYLTAAVWSHTELAPNKKNANGATWTWVTIPGLIGSILNTFANYLSYFQVINQKSRHRTREKWSCLRLVAFPEKDLGHIAALLQVIAGLIANGGAILPLFYSATTNTEHNLLNVGNSLLNYIIYMAANVCVGQYNGWCRLEKATLKSIPVWFCWVKMVPLSLGIVKTLININSAASIRCNEGDCSLYLYGCWAPSFISSVMNVVTGWLGLMMWKSQNFGLGLAKNITGHRKLKIDLLQQVMIAVYCVVVTCSFIEIGFWAKESNSNYSTGNYYESTLVNSLMMSIQELFLFYGILFVISVVHFTPKHHPYDYFIWCIRYIGVFSLARAALFVRQMSIYF